MNMCLHISIYYQEDRQEFGIFLAGKEIKIVSGNEAENMFNDTCSQLEGIGYLGRQVEVLDDRKAYLIEKD